MQSPRASTQKNEERAGQGGSFAALQGAFRPRIQEVSPQASNPILLILTPSKVPKMCVNPLLNILNHGF